METITEALAGQQRELAELLAPLGEADWSRPSRCAGWTIADVVLHLAQTNELAVASAQGRFAPQLEVLAGAATETAPLHAAGADEAGASRAVGSVEDGAGVLVDAQRGAPAAAVHERWRASVGALAGALEAVDPHQRVQWVAGDLSARTLATTRLAETWIHTGDIAAGLGVDLAPTARLWHVARLAWRTLPYAFAGAGRSLTGPVAFELAGPDGDAWSFRPDTDAVTVVRGPGADLCLVAARRADPVDVALTATGPDADAVLELVRTFA